MTQPHLTRPDLEAAIQKYGPILQVNPTEPYQNCSIEFFLSHATLIDSKDPSKNIVHPTASQLPQAPKKGTQYYFQIEDACKPGDFSTAIAYVNALCKTGWTYTDIQFWFFSAFNGPGTALFSSLEFNKVKHTGTIDLSPLGEHVGDWEYAAIRIDNTTKELIGIILSEHGKNILHPKADFAKTFTFEGTHPLIYSSRNGHANFPSPGPNFTEPIKILGSPVGLQFDLLNTTAAGGNRLLAYEKYQVVEADWLKGTPNAYPSPAWLGYPYRWGPEGTSISMDSKTLGQFIVAALGKSEGVEVDELLVVKVASELLHAFVRSDINGSAAPAWDAAWLGNY